MVWSDNVIVNKNSKFCGEAICDEHGKKKRPDPQNTTQYFRICDNCDLKYINRIILKEFHERVKRRDKEIQQYEKLIREQQIKMADSQREFGLLTVKVIILVCFKSGIEIEI